MSIHEYSRDELIEHLQERNAELERAEEQRDEAQEYAVLLRTLGTKMGDAVHRRYAGKATWGEVVDAIADFDAALAKNPNPSGSPNEGTAPGRSSPSEPEGAGPASELTEARALFSDWLATELDPQDGEEYDDWMAQFTARVERFMATTAGVERTVQRRFDRLTDCDDFPLCNCGPGVCLNLARITSGASRG